MAILFSACVSDYKMEPDIEALVQAKQMLKSH